MPLDAPDSWNLPYLNLVVSGETALSPTSLLKRLKEIEQNLGRDHLAARWAPRTIDLDILAWDEKVIKEEGLIIPHPEILNRPFFLNLMATLRSNWRYPVPGGVCSNLTLDEILHKTIKFDPKDVKCFIPFPQMVGIVNVTPDSFSDGGFYLYAERAFERIGKLITQGAAVIDIGAQSTKPGAVSITASEEWRRLEPVLSLVAERFRFRDARPQISLDSYSPVVIQKALKLYPIDWINDVTGGSDPNLLTTVAEAGCGIILNHSLSVPASTNLTLPFEANPISFLCDWALRKIDSLNSVGIAQEKIILDPGIGFGKSAFQSLYLLREINAFKKLGCKVLVGHSRKSFLRVKSDLNLSERDYETIGIAHYLLRRGVDYLRVHNVEAHQQSLSSHALLEGLHV